MSARYYRLLAILAASLSLPLGACGWTHKSDPASAGSPPPTAAPQQASADPDDGMDTEATLWTMLGIAKKPSELKNAEQTGRDVSPELWQAVHDTLSFVKINEQDPMTGLIVTQWYTPKGKPDERLRVTAFVKSRALRSDSIAVSIERQVHTPDGQWQDSTIAREVVSDLENDILLRARQIHAERLRAQQQ
jgi:hypothetical protein